MASGQERKLRRRIKSVQSTKKITRAMELIAASRIVKAQQRVAAARPYSEQITEVIRNLAAGGAETSSPLLVPREHIRRVGFVVITSDRGMAGAYSASVIRETERLVERLQADGKEVALYVSGRRAVSYYTFRRRALAAQWQGGSDAPQVDVADEIADTLLGAFGAPADEGGVAELHVVYTQFVNMVTQRPRVVRMLPLEVVEGVAPVGERDALPLYDFEPSPEAVLDALLPRYVRSRIYSCMLQAAASELAARQRAMHTATENAEDLVRMYTRLANQARQAEITQEISEIVSGADALAS